MITYITNWRQHSPRLEIQHTNHNCTTALTCRIVCNMTDIPLLCMWWCSKCTVYRLFWIWFLYQRLAKKKSKEIIFDLSQGFLLKLLVFAITKFCSEDLVLKTYLGRLCKLTMGIYLNLLCKLTMGHNSAQLYLIGKFLHLGCRYLRLDY